QRRVFVGVPGVESTARVGGQGQGHAEELAVAEGPPEVLTGSEFPHDPPSVAGRSGPARGVAPGGRTGGSHVISPSIPEQQAELAHTHLRGCGEKPTPAGKAYQTAPGGK